MTCAAQMNDELAVVVGEIVVIRQSGEDGGRLPMTLGEELTVGRCATRRARLAHAYDSPHMYLRPINRTIASAACSASPQRRGLRRANKARAGVAAAG